MTGPRRLHNACIKQIEHRHTEPGDIFILFGLLGVGLGTIVAFLLAASIFYVCKAVGIHMSDLVGTLISTTPAMFISTVAVRALYRKFRREQEEVFNTLKKDYRA
jgi:small-conductance mechanosensitive channel